MIQSSKYEQLNARRPGPKTREQIERLVRITGKPEKTVIREVVTNGLKTYSATPSKSARAVLDLIEWAEKEHIT